ncbi:hypothetical protein HYH02_015002 [Chlamydomonas schloesseri]|uniref:Uncharacterized protein n=1 Tax=Chlamydomonas schloesseri TaxID=2026947 RepID=A0A835SS28_9CHLO|nr:hypothetical protein HYH02_015002 [Chlamydomonas schloesseri]|eukprot:KAG2425630.1 hypothetical protein HYH02_015002 [Chlamydomonas schloesseri]
MLARGSTLRVRMVGPDVPREWHAAQLAYDSRGVTAGRAALTTDLAADEAAEASQQPAGGLQAQSSGREGRGRGGQQGMAQSGNTRIEFSFWSCPLHEAPESLLRDCLFAPTAPHREELSASIPSMPSAQASAAEQLQSPQSAGQAVPADARPLLPPPLPPPLVVLAPNAGLPAYMSWLPSLELLVAASSSRSRTSGTPAATPLAPVDGGADATAGDGDVGRARNGSGGGGSNDGAGGGQGCGRICSEVVAGVADWCKRLEDLKGHGNGNGGSGNDSLVLRPLYCMFTAFNEEEVLRSEQMLSQLYGVVQDVACAENPFMQPLWCVERAGNALPSFSNGFMFGWCADGVGGR